MLGWGGAMVYEENSYGLDKMHMDVVLSNKHEFWGGRGDYQMFTNGTRDFKREILKN